MARLRVGLIGTGKHGIRYARHLVRDLHEDAELVAIARRSADVAAQQAEELGCRTYRDHRDLVAAPDVDALIAVVPPTVCPIVCEAAVDAKKPLLLEKPAAPSVEAARRMLVLVRNSGAPVMVAQTLRYNSVVRALRDASAQIGPIHALRLSQRFEPSPLDWIDDPQRSGGGIILHTGVHSFDLLRWLTGLEVESVACELGSVVTRRTEDNFSASLRLENGVIASVAGSRATRSRTGPIEIVGADGLLQGDHVLGTASLVTGTKLTALAVEPPVPTVREVARDFVRAVLEDRPLPIPLEEGLRGVAIADACYRSARERTVVSVADVGSGRDDVTASQ